MTEVPGKGRDRPTGRMVEACGGSPPGGPAQHPFDPGGRALEQACPVSQAHPVQCRGLGSG